MTVMVCVPLGAQTVHRDSVIAQACRYNPKFISALFTIGYCYECLNDYKQALEWYEKYLKQAEPGSKGYEQVASRINHLKAEAFMQ